MMCPGTTHEKAEHLFDVIIGPEKEEQHDAQERVGWSGDRMTHAFKMLVYFSEIFPKHYWSNFMDVNTPRSEIAQAKGSKPLNAVA